MTRTFPGFRRVLAILATLGLLMSAFPAMTIAVGAAGLPSGDGIQPVALAGNRNCTNSDADFELRINAPADGPFTHVATGFTITLDVRDTAEGQVFDYTSTGGTIYVIYVKAGPDTNRYTYPGGNLDGADTALHGTVNPSNGRYYGLSHISICFDDTTTPTVATTSSQTGTVLPGTSVTDTATVSGTGPTPTGTVSFFLCQPADVTAAGCATGGSQVGSAVALVSGSATSSATTNTTTEGKYCWRAEYSGDGVYSAASHTNSTTECFTVAKNVPGLTTDPWIYPNDSATFSALAGADDNDFGTVRFSLHEGDATCALTSRVFLSPVITVTGNGDVLSTNNTTFAIDSDNEDTYYWQAVYSGDANNTPVTTACTAEQFDIDFTVAP